MVYGPLTNNSLANRPRRPKSPSAIKRTQLLVDALREDATDTSPVKHWIEGVGRVVKGAASGHQQTQVDKMEDERRQYMADILGGTTDPAELMRQGMTEDMPELAEYGQYQERRADKLAEKRSTDDLDEYNFYRQQQEAAGQEPVPFYDYQLGLKRANATNVNTSVNTGENAYAKERAGGKGGFASTANTIDTEAMNARSAINTIGAMRNTVGDPNFYSGIGAEGVMKLKQMAVSLGGNPDQVTSMESFGALTKQAALNAMGGSLGAGFSNADRDFVTGQVASAQNTPQGNLAILDISEKLQRRKIEISKIARKYEQDNGQIDNGLYDVLETWAEANPLFPEAAGTPPAPKKPYKIIGVE